LRRGPRLRRVIDTHAHLSICEPPDGELVADARRVGVSRILTVGLDEATNREAIAAAEAHEEVFACVGRHPNSATGFDDRAAAEIEELADHPRVRAIGETGLDYFRDRAPAEDQRRAFEAQIEIARRKQKPLVIHLRERGDGDLPDGAVAEAFSTLDRLAGGVEVILHCFSAASRVEEAARHGWFCSFAGNVTFPKSEALRDAAATVPDELLLVETDSPFLAPQPVRGKPNEPANVVATAETVAQVREIGYEQLEQIVEANAARAFGW
jgi:TatD DNase family protein